jgi:hypothetical protein
VAAGASNDFLTNLNAYWALSESTGSTRADSHTNGYDLDSEIGTVNLDNTVKNGNGASFTSSSDYLERLSAANAEGFDNITQFSISCWARIDNISSGVFDHILSCWDSGGSVREGWSLAFGTTGTDVRLVLYIGDDVTAFANGNQQNASYMTNATVYHLVATYDAGTIVLYVDGSSVSSADFGTVPTSIQDLDSTHDLEVGSVRAGATFRMLDGDIAEIGFWSGRVLDATDVSDLYNSGTGLFYADFE